MAEHMTTPVLRPDATVPQSVSWWTLAASVLLTAAPLAVFLGGDLVTRQIVLAAAAMAIAAYATLVHPLSIFHAAALVLGFVPYLDVPGTNVPVLLILAVGVWVALMVLPGTDVRPGWCEFWLFVVAGTAMLSVVATGLTLTSFTEYAAWLAATAIVVPVRFLPHDARRAMVRSFVLAAAAAAVVGLVLLRLDPYGVFLRRLAFVGYSPTGINLQQVGGSATITNRLTGTFVEPNIAGLVLAAAVLLALAYFRGPLRVALVVVIGTGLLLTLSRSAIATVVVAGFLLALRLPGRRLIAVAAVLAASFASLAIPQVRTRLLDSFGPSDTGTLLRDLALQQFPRAMDGNWWWGLGWAREEFRNPALGRVINFVANGPLMTMYRGGVVLAAVVILVLVLLVVRSWIVAGRSFEDAVACCSVIAFVLVALQLDFPIIIQAPATFVFSFLIALSMPAGSRPRSTTEIARA
jgi:hypothetical protein